jgi:hypothetical protein
MEQPDKVKEIQHMETYCRVCGEQFPEARWKLGYKFCMDCNKQYEDKREQSRCVVPMHKSNYILVTDKDLLTGVNNKGGLVK